MLYYQGKVNGRGIRRALGDVEVVSLLEARAAVNRLRYDRSTAGILAPRPSGDAAGDESPILASVVDDMLAARAAGRWLPGRRRRQGPPTERTTQFYEDLMNATTTAHETLTLQGFADKLLDIYSKLQAKAPVQANRALQLWRNIFTVATDSGLWRGANPAVATSGTSRMTQTPEIPRQRVLTDAEWKRLDAAMVKDDPLWRDLSTLSIRSLQRMGACCRARWSDISLTGNDAAWRTPAADMKGRAGGGTRSRSRPCRMWWRCSRNAESSRRRIALGCFRRSMATVRSSPPKPHGGDYSSWQSFGARTKPGAPGRTTCGGLAAVAWSLRASP